jgi:hypothetical protein
MRLRVVRQRNFINDERARLKVLGASAPAVCSLLWDRGRQPQCRFGGFALQRDFTAARNNADVKISVV